MAIKTNFTAIPKGQDMTLVGTLVDDAGVLITTDISAWTFICEIRATWAATTTVYTNITPTIDNVTKKVTFTIPKATTESLASANYAWHIRRTGAGTEKSLGYGTIYLGKDPPAGKTA
jgi:hypothetical protein